MKISQLQEMVGGWFVGDFDPVAYRTKAAEVACKYYKAGDVDQRHVHKVATEVTLLVSGRVQINETELLPGQIATILPGEAAAFRAIEDSITVVVKMPSVIGDKFPLPDISDPQPTGSIRR